MCMCIYIYIYTHTHTYVYVYIYIYFFFDRPMIAAFAVTLVNPHLFAHLNKQLKDRLKVTSSHAVLNKLSMS